MAMQRASLRALRYNDIRESLIQYARPPEFLEERPNRRSDVTHRLVWHPAKVNVTWHNRRFALAYLTTRRRARSAASLTGSEVFSRP